jgi:hypothetical protein
MRERDDGTCKRARGSSVAHWFRKRGGCLFEKLYVVNGNRKRSATAWRFVTTYRYTWTIEPIIGRRRLVSP